MKKTTLFFLVFIILAFIAGYLMSQYNVIGENPIPPDNLSANLNEEKTEKPKDTLIAHLNVIEKESPSGFYPMVVMVFPGIPGSRTESWCYEADGLRFVSYERVFGGELELRHEYDGGTVITRVIPFRNKVEFVAHVENQTKEPPFLNMCWQLREAPNFKAIDEDLYSELIEREFIFMKDSGRVFLNHTERRPRAGSDGSEWFNTPYSWIQIYKPDWKDLPKEGNPTYTVCNDWSNCSPDRYNKTVIGAVSRDGNWLMAIAAGSNAHDLCNAWHDCMHVWVPWEEGIWRNTIYAMENDAEKLLEKYEADFE